MAPDIYLLVIITCGLALIGTLIQKKLMDIDLVRSLKGEIKKLEKEAKAAKNDVNKQTKIISKQLNIQKQLLSHTMKPAMISSIPILIALMIMGNSFHAVTLALPFALPWIGSTLGWLGIYILVSLISTMIFRKLLGLDVMG
jgi:uncharacterized membrane protein (DUF106 family)